MRACLDNCKWSLEEPFSLIWQQDFEAVNARLCCIVHMHPGYRGAISLFVILLVLFGTFSTIPAATITTSPLYGLLHWSCSCAPCRQTWQRPCSEMPNLGP